MEDTSESKKLIERERTEFRIKTRDFDPDKQLLALERKMERSARRLRFSESWGESGNGASHLASCPNYHFVVELAASSATIVWEWRSGMSGAAKIDSDRGAASLLRLLMPAVHFHLRISSEHSPASPPPFPSCLLSFRIPAKGSGTEVGSESRRQSEEQASGVIL